MPKARRSDVCPKCSERRGIRRGKTAATMKDYCNCPACGHLWDPKGEQVGKARKATKETGKGKRERTLAEAVDWALCGDVRGYGPGRARKFWVRVLHPDASGIREHQGSGDSPHEALLEAYDAFISPNQATMD
jgi:hypothetical protein